MNDKADVVSTAGRLVRLNAFRGAAQVLFNAALQRQAAERRDLAEWTPSGPLPLRRKAEKHLHAANDQNPTPSEPSGTVA